MDATSLHQPYRLDNLIRVRFSDSLTDPDFAIDSRKDGYVHGVPFAGSYYDVEMRIKHVFVPFTLSAVMKVAYKDPRSCEPRTALLKLFDRRFMNNEREEQNMADCTPETEEGLRELIGSGKAQELLRRWIAEDYDGDSAMLNDTCKDSKARDEDLIVAECQLQYTALQLFETESFAYKIFKHLQGTRIPRLIALVTVLPDENSSGSGNPANMRHKVGQTASPTGVLRHDIVDPMTAIPGLLLEFIDGSFGLDQLIDRVPPSDWRTVVELAASVACDVAAGAFRNDDVRPENMLISASARQSSPPAEGDAKIEHTYKCRMVDFAIGCIRGPEDTDRKWVRIKAGRDEARHVYEEVDLKVCEIHEKMPYGWLRPFDETPWDHWTPLRERMEAVQADWVWEMDVKCAEYEEELVCSKPKVEQE